MLVLLVTMEAASVKCKEKIMCMVVVSQLIFAMICVTRVEGIEEERDTPTESSKHCDELKPSEPKGNSSQTPSGPKPLTEVENCGEEHGQYYCIRMRMVPDRSAFYVGETVDILCSAPLFEDNLLRLNIEHQARKVATIYSDGYSKTFHTYGIVSAHSGLDSKYQLIDSRCMNITTFKVVLHVTHHLHEGHVSCCVDTKRCVSMNSHIAVLYTKGRPELDLTYSVRGGKNMLRANCSSQVGSSGSLTWVLLVQGIPYLWLADLAGKVQRGSRGSSDFPTQLLNVTATVTQDETRGPMVVSLMTLHVTYVLVDAVLACYSYPASGLLNYTEADKYTDEFRSMTTIRLTGQIHSAPDLSLAVVARLLGLGVVLILVMTVAFGSWRRCHPPDSTRNQGETSSTGDSEDDSDGSGEKGRGSWPRSPEDILDCVLMNFSPGGARSARRNALPKYAKRMSTCTDDGHESTSDSDWDSDSSKSRSGAKKTDSFGSTVGDP